jgi:hypothetical protein
MITKKVRSPAVLSGDAAPAKPVKPVHAKAMPVVLHDEDFDGRLSGEYDSVLQYRRPTRRS